MAGIGLGPAGLNHTSLQLDLAHPLSRGLLIAQFYGVLLYPRTKPMTSDKAMQSGIFGPSFGGSDTATLPANNATSSYTLTLLGPTTSDTTANNCLIGYRLNGGPGLTFTKVNANGIFEYMVGAAGYNVGSASNINVLRSLFAIKSNLTLSLYKDLALDGTRTEVGTALDQNAATVYVTGDDEFPATYPGRSTIGMIHTRALETDERAQLHVNPFCMLHGG